MAVLLCAAAKVIGVSMRITKLAPNEFRFESDSKLTLEKDQTFTFEECTYKIIHATHAFEIDGYHSALVVAEPA